MVIDSSALTAIIFEEPAASMYISAILNDMIRLVSAASLLETSMVVMDKTKGDAIAALDRIVSDLSLAIVPVDYEQVLLARDGFRRYGKGRHPAKLNYGDCFSYALAKQRAEPPLFKGSDFSQTDIAIA